MTEINETDVLPAVTCDICGKPFDKERQLLGHRPHCLRKQAAESLEIEIEREKSIAEFDIAADDESAEYTEDRDGDRESERTERIPFGTAQPKLFVPEREGYRRRIFNDNWVKEPGRIERAKQAGYRVVEDSPINGKTVGSNRDGSPIKAMVMEIPRKWFEEDQEKKAELIDRMEKQMMRGELDQTEPAANRYVPEGMMKQTVYTN